MHQNQNPQPLLAAVIETSLACLILVDEKGCILEFNPAAEAAFGYTRAEAVGQPVAELIIPEHLRTRIETGFQDYVAGTRALNGRRIEIGALHKSGRIFPAELTLNEAQGEHGRVVIASLRDLTSGKTQQQQMEATRRELELAIEAADLGVWTYDLDNRVGDYSPRAREMVGMDMVEPLTPHAVSRFVHPEDWERVTGPYANHFSGGDDIVDVEWRAIHPDGSYRWLYTIGKAVRDEQGIARTVNGVHIDITSRKAAAAELASSREALHQSEKLSALGSLLAGVSHELNNPLSAIMAHSEMLEEDCVGTPSEQRARHIRSAAERCARIVQTFLAMARRREPQREPVDMNRIVDAALQLAAYALRTAGIAVTVERAHDLPPIMGDRDLLHQVVLNLLINAQQALEAANLPGKAVLIRTGTEGGKVVIDIVDTGPGIGADVAGRIFEPFFTTKTKGSGTGVGLSFSQGIVEAHGGTLGLQPSERGAAFRIALPVAATSVAAESEAAAPPAPPAPQRRSALVVDDEPDVGLALAELLQRQGFAVTRAEDGEAAMHAVQTRDFDVILSDLRMPGVSGPEFYRRLVASRPHAVARLAFVTGDTLGATMADFLEGCGRPVLEKPFTRKAIEELIGRLEPAA